MKKKTKKRIGPVERANKRRATTKNKLELLIQRHDINTDALHLKSDKKAARAAKSFARVAMKFMKEYHNACDKHSDVISSEPMTRQAIINIITKELST